MGEPPETKAGRQGRRRRGPPKPLDKQSLRDLALNYAGRYATSAAKLKHYLHAKLRTRGWAGEDEPQVDALVARMVELGYIDDAAFAEVRTRDLLRRGYGARRVAQALHQAGVDRAAIALPEPGVSETRSAALSLARRRRLGPFGAGPPDPKRREKQLAALVRAGHEFETARAIIDAASEAEAEEWAANPE